MERMEEVEWEGDRVVVVKVGEGERLMGKEKEGGEGERGWKEVGRWGRGVRPKGRDIVVWLCMVCGVGCSWS